MTLLPSYNEYKIGDTVYKVTSIFSEKGTLKEVYEELVISSEKCHKPQHIVYNSRVINQNTIYCATGG